MSNERRTTQFKAEPPPPRKSVLVLCTCYICGTNFYWCELIKDCGAANRLYYAGPTLPISTVRRSVEDMLRRRFK